MAERTAGQAAHITTNRPRVHPVRRLLAAATGGPVPSTGLAPVTGLLFLSGMCGLIFQVAWFREFRLVFGASTAASSAVLAVFMGGLGLGNAVLGKWADRVRHPLAMYAFLELSIAAAAALSPLFIDALARGLHSLRGTAGLGVVAGHDGAASSFGNGLRHAHFLDGGHAAAAVRAATGAEDHQRRGVAWLYGANTFGAVVGALVSTFFALEFFGTRETLWLACLLNVGTALLALTLARRGAGNVIAVGARPVDPAAPSRQMARIAARAKV